MKKIWLAIGLLAVLSFGAEAATAKEASKKSIKNVIILIPDGMGVTHTTISRWYNGGAPLVMDEFACGLVRTYSSDFPIADSAPAGTAMSTGYKSHPGYVGVLPDVADMYGTTPVSVEDSKKPLATILEAAKLSGKSTGIVSTSNIQHATPADFSSHFYDRNNYEVLGEQQVYNNIDVVLGAGYKYLMKDKRKDREDLLSELKNRGYEFIKTRDEMVKSSSSKLWGLFAEDSMAYEMDRLENAPSEPSIEEMSSKAISILSKNDKGFFLMIEGSKVDWASHANDPIGVISDVLAFDKSVKIAIDFAKKDKNTAVIIASDHGNGGMSMGDSTITKGYDTTPLSKFIEPLKKAKLTGEGLEQKINKDKSNIKEVLAENYGINDLTEQEIKAITEAKPTTLSSVVGPMISKRSLIAWTTGGHTGEEVVLHVYHPEGYRPYGVIQNSDIGKYMAEVMGVNLDDTSKKLFVNIISVLDKNGADYYYEKSNKESEALREKIKQTTEASEQMKLEAEALKIEGALDANSTLIVEKGKDVLKVFSNKDFVEFNGKIVKSKGVNVFIDGGKFYVSQEIVNLVK